MSSISHVTFAVGDRSPEVVIAEVERAVRKLWDNDDRLPDAEPTVSEFRGNVVWSRSQGFSRLRAVTAQRAVKTTYNDTSDGGSALVFEQLGDRFIQVDRVESPTVGDHYVVDYCRVNYGIIPRYGYSRVSPVGTTDREDADEEWDALLSVDDADELPVEPARVGEWVSSGANGDRPDRERLLDMLAIDPYYHPVRQRIATLEGEPATAAFDRLDADDPDVRARAVRRIAAAESVRHWRDHSVEADRYKGFLNALETVDKRTRALVAPPIWSPATLETDGPPDPSLVPALVSLLDDPVPELRIAGLAGASRVLGALQKAVDECDLEDEAAYGGIVEPFYDAYEAALTDDDVRVRERAVMMAWQTLLARTGAHVFGFWDRLPFERRWEIATTYTAVDAAEPTATTDEGGLALTSAFEGEPAAVSTLVEYAYEQRGPYNESVREELAQFAADEPTAALPALEPAVEAIAAGTETPADVDIVAELAAEQPDRVATVADELATMLELEADGEGDTKRRAAARALKQLPETSAPVAQATLHEATIDVFDDYRLVADRVGSLAVVSPDEATDLLASLPAEIGDDGHEKVDRRAVEQSFREGSERATAVVANALPDVGTLLADPAAVFGDLPIALALTATDHPDAVGEYADEIGTFLGSPYPLIREAAATALVLVGTATPDVLSPPLATLLDRADDAIPADELADAHAEPPTETPPDWPLGVLAAADTEFTVDAVAAFVPDRQMHGSVPELVGEIAVGDREVAVAVLELLLDRSGLGRGSLSEIATEWPAVVMDIVDQLLETLAGYDDEADEGVSLGLHPVEDARSIEDCLTILVTTNPETVRNAIESHYRSVTAFVEAVPTDDRRALRAHLTAEE